MSELAKTNFANFNQSTQPLSLDTVIMLHQEALCLCSNQHAKQAVSLSSLAILMYARFLHTEDMPNLNEAILILCGGVQGSPESDLVEWAIAVHGMYESL
jgi:hypothetical protein